MNDRSPITPVGKGPRCHEVLWIDDEVSPDDSSLRILELEGYRVTCAQTGGSGLQMGLSEQFQLIILDLRLPDVHGLAVLSRLVTATVRTPVIVLTGYGDVECAFSAGRIGARGFLEKPVSSEELLAVMKSALAQPTKDSVADLALRPEIRQHVWVDAHVFSPAAEAWALLVRSIFGADYDPRTLEDWGTLASVARSTIESRCRAAGVLAKNSLDFGRMLRALVYAARLDCDVTALIDADPRTLKKLLATAGLSFGKKSHSGIATVDEYILRQRFIVNDLALAAIQDVLRRLGILDSQEALHPRDHANRQF
jgi:CheY-like chemotaxis protein